jgi:hypothetical protein
VMFCHEHLDQRACALRRAPVYKTLRMERLIQQLAQEVLVATEDRRRKAPVQSLRTGLGSRPGDLK